MKQKNAKKAAMMSKSASEYIDSLLSKPVNFLDGSASGSPVVISSRIRLARNIGDFPFPSAAGEAVSAEICAVADAAVKRSAALGRSHIRIAADDLSSLEKEILFERRLASRELLAKENNAVLHTSSNQNLALMINEEDHLRLQAVLPGLQLHKCWKILNAADDKLSGVLDIAYDSRLGYLTACPSNVGTGMRVSIMMHLPALAMAEQIKPLERGLSKLGLTVRGMFGEGSENLGDFYQVSNQSTLGESEEDIIDRLGQVADQICSQEEHARDRLLEVCRNRLRDKVGRCFGILRYAGILTAREAYNSLSGIRLGVDMNMFNSLDIDVINELFMSVPPGHLQKKAGRILSEEECNVFRAQQFRDRLKQCSAG